MGPVGVQEMIVIFLVALVLFGPKKLPELGRTIGKAITEFRRAQSELKATFAGHMQELEKEHESIKEVTRSFTSDIQNHFDPPNHYDSANHYDSPYWDTGAYGAESHESTPATPSTVSASAPQGAESTVSQEAAVHGTVPRTNGQHESPAAAPPHASQDASAQLSPDQHSVNS
jgi:sec-independent protein translocase protein TatA